LVDLYERLRDQALGKLFANGQGLGLALFMRKGMAAWIQVWTEYTSKAKAVTTDKLDIRDHLSENINNQITMVLTSMIMDLSSKGD